MSETSILARPVEVAAIAAAGLDVQIVANAEERATLAAAYDLVAVKALSATAQLQIGEDGAVSVTGRVVADITQTCVVSLAPVDQRIDEPFSVRFVAPDSLRTSGPPKPGREVVVDPNQPDPPEILEGPAIDVGALVEEHFVLAIDPYPRAPDATMPAEATTPVDARRDSPFAPLAGITAKPAKKG